MRRTAAALLSAAALLTAVVTPATGGEPSLARHSLRDDPSGMPFYMLMIDRFANGDPRNDRGGLDSPDRLKTGFDPTDKQFFHGGDLAGLTGRLDYLAGLGIKAVWINPPFRNRWVVDLGPVGAFAAYHGYAITDFTSFDPHFGTTAEMRTFVDRAHRRGIKVFFDITAGYTADVIGYDGPNPYRSLAEAPYKDAQGNEFDIEAYAGRPDFPALSADVSFPYRPVVTDPGLKKPAWLNDPTLYHNRGGASVFEGEQLLYGDFFGLDDLMTEHPRVVAGMTRIYESWISNMGIDGYRVDTVKHVNTPFWQAFAPAIKRYAAGHGKPGFFVFGEVFSGNPVETSHYTTAGRMQSVLDFGFQGAARSFVAGHGASGLSAVADSDDLYTDADSNAYSLTTFVDNHDIGRLAMMLKQDRPGIGESELLARLKLANQLLFFWRGNPVLYYGDEQGFVGTGGDADGRQDMFGTQVPDQQDQDMVGTDSTPAVPNFDRSHPLYRQLAGLTAYTRRNPVWHRGNQVLRLADPEVVAFSRIDPVTQHEYLVAANSSTSPKTVDIPAAAGSFTQDWPAGSGGAVASGGTVRLTLPPLSVTVHRSRDRVPLGPSAPAPSLSLLPATSDGRTGLQATTPGVPWAEATFAARVHGQSHWTILGTDDAAPYRLYADLSKLPGASTSTQVDLRAVVRDAANRQATTTLTTLIP